MKLAGNKVDWGRHPAPSDSNRCPVHIHKLMTVRNNVAGNFHPGIAIQEFPSLFQWRERECRFAKRLIVEGLQWSKVLQLSLVAFLLGTVSRSATAFGSSSAIQSHPIPSDPIRPITSLSIHISSCYWLVSLVAGTRKLPVIRSQTQPTWTQRFSGFKPQYSTGRFPSGCHFQPHPASKGSDFLETFFFDFLLLPNADRSNSFSPDRMEEALKMATLMNAGRNKRWKVLRRPVWFSFFVVVVVVAAVVAVVAVVACVWRLLRWLDSHFSPFSQRPSVQFTSGIPLALFSSSLPPPSPRFLSATDYTWADERGKGVPNESTDTMGSMRQRCVLRAVEGTKLAHYKQARRITGHETNALDNVMTFSWTG